MLPTTHSGNDLLDLLTARREAILAAVAADPAALPPALAARRLDCLLAGLHDDPAVTQRAYADDTLKPEFRAGLTLESLHSTLVPFIIQVHATIDEHRRNAATRTDLHADFDRRLREAYTFWEAIAQEVAQEQHGPTTP